MTVKSFLSIDKLVYLMKKKTICVTKMVKPLLHDVASFNFIQFKRFKECTQCDRIEPEINRKYKDTHLKTKLCIKLHLL